VSVLAGGVGGIISIDTRPCETRNAVWRELTRSVSRSFGDARQTLMEQANPPRRSRKLSQTRIPYARSHPFFRVELERIQLAHCRCVWSIHVCSIISGLYPRVHVYAGLSSAFALLRIVVLTFSRLYRTLQTAGTKVAQHR